MFKRLLIKIYPLVLLASIIITTQIIILKPHLQYGFSDVDWGFLSIYKTQNPYSVSQFINNFKIGGTRGGVYTHQIYYIGIQHELFGLNFKSFQITTHIFKTLAILASIPFFLAVSGSLFVAFIGTILFAFSYSAVGTMYTVVTSSDYLAILPAGIFISLYSYIVRKKSGSWRLLIAALILMVMSLFLSTERMYPLPVFVGLTEVFLLFIKKTAFDKNTRKRILVLLAPLLLIFFAFPFVFLSFVSAHGIEIIQRISAGNWNLLLTPFIVLGSIVIPHDYTKYLGLAKMDSLFSFLDFLLTGPLLSLVTVTVVLAILIFKKSQVIIQILGLTGFFSVVLYILGSHFADHQISVESIVQALIGLYILAFSIVSFLYWRKHKDRLFIGLFAGPFFALVYIFLTWIGAATSEIFSGIHRYLTIPALFMSLFLGSLISLMILRIFNLSKRFKLLRISAIIPIILLLVFINVNAKEINAFFNSQLTNGFGALDKQMMRDQLLIYLDNLSADKPSLIYFDFTQDNDNGYYYDNTLLGGFGSWILWHKNINFDEGKVPSVFWNNYQLLKASISEQGGKTGFQFNKRFFELENFYAFSLMNKKVYDIKNQVLNDLGIY